VERRDAKADKNGARGVSNKFNETIQRLLTSTSYQSQEEVIADLEVIKAEYSKSVKLGCRFAELAANWKEKFELEQQRADELVNELERLRDGK